MYVTLTASPNDIQVSFVMASFCISLCVTLVKHSPAVTGITLHSTLITISLFPYQLEIIPLFPQKPLYYNFRKHAAGTKFPSLMRKFYLITSNNSMLLACTSILISENIYWVAFQCPVYITSLHYYSCTQSVKQKLTPQRNHSHLTLSIKTPALLLHNYEQNKMVGWINNYLREKG